MKKFTVILLIIMGVAMLLGSVSHSWAGDQKKVVFNFVLNFDDKGNITGVEAWDPKTKSLKAAAEKKDAVTGVVRTGTIYMLNTDDPCVEIGGRRYCW
jgi:hypothetical protein